MEIGELLEEYDLLYQVRLLLRIVLSAFVGYFIGYERKKRKRRTKPISLDTEIVGQESVMYADTVTYDDLDYINYV